jgi:hypothetical protein
LITASSIEAERHGVASGDGAVQPRRIKDKAVSVGEDAAEKEGPRGWQAARQPCGATAAHGHVGKQ